MQKTTIPVCYFPSTVLFVDDSRDFLLNFVLQLEEDLSYQVFDSPQKALTSICHVHGELERLKNRCLSEYTEAEHCPTTNSTINLNLSAIHGEIYNRERFSEVSCVVVDYAMPGMNGLEFCQKLKHLPIKKILLTGQADEKIAIEAFNKGLIDRYIKKNAENVSGLITDAIRQLQADYFSTMSETITNMLSVASPNCLQDEVFIDFFKDLLKSKAVVEYYLMDNSGSFLMLDAEGEMSSLIVKNEQDLKAHYDLGIDNGANQDVLDNLREGKKIPAFARDLSFDEPWSEWSSCLLPADALKGKETYFFSMIEDKSLLNLRKDGILSYGQYLEDLA